MILLTKIESSLVFIKKEEADMNKQLGQIITAVISEITEKAVFAQKNGQTYQVTSEVEKQVGEEMSGLAYLDQNDRLSLATDIPIAEDRYDWAEVVNVQRDLGVFVDIGLPNKDIVVSRDHLPDIRQLWPKVGDHLYVTLEVDEAGRLWGRMATQDIFQQKAHKGSKTQHNNDIKGHVFELRQSGSYIITSDFYLAYIPTEEREQEPRLGQLVTGRVIGLREDGILYASLKPRAHEVLDDDAQMIYEVIKRSDNHKIPYHDKSDPEAIRAFFGISKGAFKRAVGRLMKQDLVEQDETGTKATQLD